MKYRMVVDGTVSDTLNPNLSPFDVEAELSVSDPAAFTALLGAWYRPIPALEIAISGRVLPVTFNAEGDVSVYNTPNQTVYGEDQLIVDGGAAAFDLTLPQTARLGIRYRGLDQDQSERFDIELALVYERWSVMDEISVKLQGGVKALGGSELNDVSIDKRWRDTLSARLGGSYRVVKGLKLSAGTFYEQGATPRQYANIDFPSYDRVGLAGGVSYEVASGIELVVGYLHIFEVDFTVDETEAKVFQQRPINPCTPDGGCGRNAQGEAYSGVPANAGRHRASFQNITLGVNAAF
jgi:long-subunit fatty acid transport protein